jgi:hypothetical protein
MDWSESGGRGEGGGGGARGGGVSCGCRDKPHLQYCQTWAMPVCLMFNGRVTEGPAVCAAIRQGLALCHAAGVFVWTRALHFVLQGQVGVQSD